MQTPDLDFEGDGARHFAGVISRSDAEGLAARLACNLNGMPGRRLLVEPDVEALLSVAGSVGGIAASLIGTSARPVRAVLFDKTRDANWTVAWHQDRTIPVCARHDVEGFGPWSVKDGLCHVAPPMGVLEQMATLRLHLDDCDNSNAPLTIALGSHRLGLVPATESASVAARHAQFTCLAKTGDVWAYSTPILHTSATTISDRRRRVLQIDYAAIDLPQPLSWLGISCD